MRLVTSLLAVIGMLFGMAVAGSGLMPPWNTGAACIINGALIGAGSYLIIESAKVFGRHQVKS